MKKDNLAKIFRAALVVLVAMTLLFGAVFAPQAQASAHQASYIEKLDNNVKVDYTKYLDSSVMYQLPETIRQDEEISVIITVDVPTLMDAYQQSNQAMRFTQYALHSEEAKDLQQQIAQRKDALMQTLDTKQVAYTTGQEYSALLSGFELVIEAKDFETVCKSLGEGENAIVGEVYQVAETQLVENTVNVYETGIFKSGESGYDGTGMVVAVLDTGLDSAHSAFSLENFTSDKLGLTYGDVAAVVDQTKAYELSGGLGVDDVYINEKVPFGYDYADNDPDVYSTHNNHGTHVSGVIVGKDDTITGVAPNAQLVSMKVFSDVMDTARSAWILAGLEDCVILGVDVINMSLGTACGFSRESDEEALSGVYQKIRDAGISLIVAASNSYSSAYGSEANGNLGLTSNPDTGTVGSPGTYEGAMSVASINGEETPYIKYKDTIIYFDESTNSFSKENDFFETLLGDNDSQTYEYVVVPGVGRTADYTGLDVTGKIALVRRGDNTFEEKAMIAEAQGAAGIIIYNNVSGEIKMNVGQAKLAVCSISQDDGEMLVQQGSGKLEITKSQTSGPFISDFSSWGPGPDLEIKPEITAHGGNILSSVTGGGYDRLSGTSMACPNLAGVVILLRQYVVENFPDIADDNVQVNRMVNRLMMSTADIALNTNGLPYAVRKQGAGLANLMASINTTAYITTYTKDGTEMDKTKLELGDDPEKTGVYEMTFKVNNFGDKKLTYNLGGYVFTEGVSETKTNAGETTVTEEAYALEGADIAVTSTTEGALKGKKLTVEPGSSAEVTVTVTLTEQNKAYLDESFANGMYVEGYITLEATKGTDVDLNVPYLAFYGDWTVAPLFDLDYYETNADELDDSIAVEDKLMPDAYATRPIGGVTEDYVSYLGSYYFLQDPDDMIISANRDYISLSNQDGAIHSLRYVWAGLLRNAQKMNISITDDTTGEVIFQTEDLDVRKSYGDGGSIYPANIEIEFDTLDYNLKNNTEYTVLLEGYLDYEDGGFETNEKNTFSFPLTIDFEAPTISDVEFYYEYDKTLEKNRLYAKVGIYDNHFAMASQLGYVALTTDADGNSAPEMLGFEQYLTPVYSQRDSVTYVEYELTDYIYDIKENALNDMSFALTVYDYALNFATYEIGLPNDYADFYFDGLEEGLTLSPNEVYSLEPLVYPETGWSELLEFTSSKPSVVRVVNNKIVAAGSGSATIKVRDPKSEKSLTFSVKVLKEGDEGYRRFDKPVADVFRLTGYDTQKAYYVLDSKEKDIGDTGDTRFFEGDFNLSLYPSETVRLNYDLDAYFPKDTTVVFETSNENIVKIDDNGNVTAVAEGYASVTVKVLMDDRSTYYSESVSVEVKDPFITTGASLTHYYGNGGLVTFPEDLALTEIGNFAFANFEYVLKTEEELAFDDAEATKQWYIGESTITKVVVPEGIEKIGAYAFANLTGLEEIVLPSTLESIEYGAFYGCSALQKITFSAENNLKIISQNAFENCDLQGTLDLSAICVISDYAFAGNQDLEGITTSDALLSIGNYAFAGCKKLEQVTITANKVKYGTYAFTGCKSLKEFTVNAAVLPEGMFYECEELEKVIIGAEVNDIGEFAFRDTAVKTLEVMEGSNAFQAQSANYVLSADGTTLAAVAPTVSGTVDASKLGGAKISTIGDGAFSHNKKVTAVELPDVTCVGDYAFGSSESIETVALGQLTEIGEYGFFETAITQLPAFTADTQIGRYAFSFTNITAVEIPNGMQIAEGVFSECMNLQTVTIGDDVTIGKYAFSMNKDNAFEVLSYTGAQVNELMGVEAGNMEVVESLDHMDDGHNKDEEETTEATEPKEEKVELESAGAVSNEDKKYFYYKFTSPMVSLTIGNNAVIGENAFQNAAALETVTLGENAQIGNMAFYNTSMLKQIDLSKAASIGNYAFSGDVYYLCLDDAMAYAAVSTEGRYMYTYHAPLLETVDLSAAQSVGEYAFAYCRDLTDVKLGDAITEIPQYSFAGCSALTNIDLSKIVTVGDYAFMENYALAKADLSAAETIGQYAFVYCNNLSELKLNANGCTVDEAAFSYCAQLAAAKELDKVTKIGDYAFAYTAMTDVDLTGAVGIGTQAFMKESLTEFKVKLGEALEELGDNPFAMCKLAPFCIVEQKDINGTQYEDRTYTYTLSPTVSVIDGSLYCRIDTGLELITYVGIDQVDAKIAEQTVRVTSMAFAGSNVQMVTLPESVRAIGHKAFYECAQLHTVVFGSYDAPILEEEFDPTYYESYKHIPGTGDFGTYQDYDGSEVQITGMGLVPYYMWNATDSMYSNVLYGANFVDYVGYVEDKLTMVRPINGVSYDSYIYNQYFDLAIDGAAAPDKTTLAAIAAIKAIPERATYEDKAFVDAAREAYTKIATIEQQALVSNYADLISAEQRMISLAPGAQEEEVPTTEEPTTQETEKSGVVGIVLGIVAGVAVLAVATWLLLKKRAAVIRFAATLWQFIKKYAAIAWSFVKKYSAVVWQFLKKCAAAAFAKLQQLLPKKQTPAQTQEQQETEEEPEQM